MVTHDITSPFSGIGKTNVPISIFHIFAYLFAVFVIYYLPSLLKFIHGLMNVLQVNNKDNCCNRNIRNI